MADEDIRDLLEESLNKLISTADQDTKKLADFNNTLN